MEAIPMDEAKELLEAGTKEAEVIAADPSKVDELLRQLEEKLKEVPAVGEALSDRRGRRREYAQHEVFNGDILVSE